MIKRINFIPYNFLVLLGISPVNIQDLFLLWSQESFLVMHGEPYAVLGLELGSPVCKANPSLYHFSNHAFYFLLLLLSSEYSKINIYFYHSLILLYENFNKKLGWDSSNSLASVILHSISQWELLESPDKPREFQRKNKISEVGRGHSTMNKEDVKETKVRKRLRNTGLNDHFFIKSELAKRSLWQIFPQPFSNC